MDDANGYIPYARPDLQWLPQDTLLRDRYLIQRVLGQGGFGITYLAWDEQLGMRVAIKEFFPQSIVSRDCSWSLDVCCLTQSVMDSFNAGKARFLRETGALRKLRKVPTIVEIFDHFEENNTVYIVMEFISGMDLKAYISQKGGRLSAEETFRILEPVFHALTVVHKEGLIHRDISPDNIMLDSAGGAKLLDFGAVRSVESPSVDKGVTTSTVAILKHGFAPIEQYNSHGTLGPWTDGYALCATVYYCLTGRKPPQVSSRLADHTEPEWEKIPDLDEHKRRALIKGMSVDPADRYPSIAELHDAIYAPPPAVKRSHKKLLAALAALILFLGVAVGGWLLADRLFGGGEEVPTEPETVPVQTEPETTASVETTEEPTTQITEPPTEPPRTWEGNVMMADPLSKLLGKEHEARLKVRSVTFRADLSGMPETTYDLSDGPGAVYGWLSWSNGSVDVFIAAEGGIDASGSCKELFMDCSNLRSIDFGGAFHTEGCESMYQMFRGCYELRELDVSFFDTSRVTTMQGMFRDCRNLTELDVSAFDTSRVTNMSQMFSTCTRIESLDLSTFDTSRVDNISRMFSACRDLRSVDVSSFDTSRVYNMDGVFQYCENLPDLTLDWDTSSVTISTSFMNDGKTVNGRPWKEFFQ